MVGLLLELVLRRSIDFCSGSESIRPQCWEQIRLSLMKLHIVAWVVGNDCLETNSQENTARSLQDRWPGLVQEMPGNPPARSWGGRMRGQKWELPA